MKVEWVWVKECVILKYKNVGKWVKDVLGMKGIYDMFEICKVVED